MKPTPEQMERAVTALVPYVQEWELPLNPEHLYELAGAVLAHFDTKTSFEEIDAYEREQIKKFTAARKSSTGMFVSTADPGAVTPCVAQRNDVLPE